VLAVVGRDRTFAGIVRETAAFGAGIERQDGVGTQRAEAHGRDVENAGVVGLRAQSDAIATCRDLVGCAANPDAEMVRCQRAGRDRMVHPLVTLGVYIELRAERSVVRVSLGALVHQRTLRA